MDYTKLKAILQEPAYSGLSDADAATALNVADQTVTFENHVTGRDLMAEVGAVLGAGILEKLEAAAASSPPIKWAMKDIDGGDGINVGHAETRAMLDSLVGTVLAQAEVDAVKALGEKVVSRALQEGFGNVSEQMVDNARTMQW